MEFKSTMNTANGKIIPIRNHPDLLKILLKDQTTGENIIWATENNELASQSFGDKSIFVDKSIGMNEAQFIKPRTEKLISEQKLRTKGRAEVFTPTWIVKKMVSTVDLEFQELSLTQYVEKKWLEITCGEAPFIISPYNSVTGESIAVNERVGFLDKKLQRINREINELKQWLKFVKKAFKSTYGYEFQGDSLLIARENLLNTFIEYYMDKFSEMPDLNSVKEIAKIISFNIVQMDGLKYTIPLTGSIQQEAMIEQISLFGFEDEVNEQEEAGIPVEIKNWHESKMILFQSIAQGGEEMKFDVVIGNPPYQEEAKGNSSSDDPIYNLFIEESYNISDKVLLITPARFLFNAGKTPKPWNKKMLNDTHLKVILFEQKSEVIFSNTDIKGGIAVTYRDTDKDFGKIGVFTAYKELQSILEKVEKKELRTLDTVVTGRGVYRLTDVALSEHPEVITIQSKGHKTDVGSGAFKILSDIIFFKKKPNDSKSYVQVLGVLNGKRVFYWVDRRYLSEPQNFLKYKIIIPKANGSGAIGEVLSTPLIGEPLIGYTETFIGMGSFDNELEAQGALKYVKTKFCRTMLGILKITQDNPKDKWSKVPLQDFTPSSDIDWTKSIPEIDQQLYKKYGLDDEEINFIETKVKEMN